VEEIECRNGGDRGASCRAQIFEGQAAAIEDFDMAAMDDDAGSGKVEVSVARNRENVVRRCLLEHPAADVVVGGKCQMPDRRGAKTGRGIGDDSTLPIDAVVVVAGKRMCLPGGANGHRVLSMMASRLLDVR